MHHQGMHAQLLVTPPRDVQTSDRPSAWGAPGGDRPTYPGMFITGPDHKITMCEVLKFLAQLYPGRMAGCDPGGAVDTIKMTRQGGAPIQRGQIRYPDFGTQRGDGLRTGACPYSVDEVGTAVAYLKGKRERVMADHRAEQAANQVQGAQWVPAKTPAAKVSAPRTRFTTCCYQVIALTAECGCGC